MGSRPYVFQQQPGHTSALEGYPEADVRFLDGLSRDAIYPKDCFSSDHGVARPARFAGCNDDNFLPSDHYMHFLQLNTTQRSEATEKMQVYSHGRDANYGRSIYGSDFKRGNRYDGWKRHDHVRDTRSLNWDRDQWPGRRREHSWSRRHDYRQTLRSPRVRSHSLSQWEDNYDHKRKREHSSVDPSATVKVMGLSKWATAKDLCRNLAEWGPFLDARVVKERNSSSCRGIAFIDFPSAVKARTMMDAIGHDGLSVDGMMLHFEYSFKKIKSEYHRMREKQRRQVKLRRAVDRGTTGAATQLQQDEDKVLRELVEEAEGRGGAEDREEEQMVEEEDEEVENSEVEDGVDGEVEDSEEGDREEEQMVEEEDEEVENSEAEDSEEEGEAEDSEAEQMVEEGQEMGDNEGLDFNVGDGEESEEEELQQGRVSTKKRSNKWTRRETKFLKRGIFWLSGETNPWTEILRRGSHIFHPKRTAEQLREKYRRMRGDTHRVRTEGRMNGL